MPMKLALWLVDWIRRHKPSPWWVANLALIIAIIALVSAYGHILAEHWLW